MHPFEILLEIIVGRLVLGLPIEDLEKINEMIRKHLKENKENAEGTDIQILQKDRL